MIKETQTRLMSQLESAFGDVEYPGDEHLVPMKTKEDAYYREYEEMFLVFKGKHWNNLSLEFVLSNYDALRLFTPEGFRFFLPAYLKVVVIHPDPAESDIIPEQLMFLLSPPTGKPEQLAEFYTRMRNLNGDQRSVIADILEAYREIYPELIEFFSPDLASVVSFWRS